MAAILDGRSVDTTMGFSPTGGLVMGTRTGDLDPGVAVYLLETRRLDAAGLSELVNKEAGLLGLSGTSSDIRDLTRSAPTDRRAQIAIDVFCYVARKYLAAMVVALGGLDGVVFTGGIGEHSAEVRSEICSGLAFLGIQLDNDLNRAGADVISKDASIPVRVMHTDEDGMIARHTEQVIGGKDGKHVRI
jgi:acetate kinase